MRHKECSKCGEMKTLDRYYRDRRIKGGRRSECKACTASAHAEYYQLNKEAVVAKQEEWNEANTEKIKEYRRGYYARNIEKYRALARSRRVYHRVVSKEQYLRLKDDPVYKAAQVKRTMEWQKRYPDKMACYRVFKRAVSSGKLVRGPCVVCGKEEVHGHHDDYDKPLEVIWLCDRHHKDHHIYLGDLLRAT